MSYKCPFCNSAETREVLKPVQSYIPRERGYFQTFTDDFVEYVCLKCGRVSKVDPNYYKEED